MNKITFFHCADLHLDTPFSTLVSKHGLPTLRRKDIFSNLARLVEAVKIAKPDFFFISGDLFEHEYSGMKTVSAVNGLFNSIPETKVIMISGNHDPEAANSLYLIYKWSNNVHFLGEEQDSLFFEDKNTRVYGLGWGPGYGQNAKLETMHPNADNINVLLFHGDIDLQIGLRDYNSVSGDSLKAKGFDYVAAGHNHKRKENNGNGIIFNPGSLEPLGFDEPGIHGYFSGEITRGELPSVNFVENSKTEYITVEYDIGSIESDNDIIEFFGSRLSLENNLYKIILTGSKPLEYKPDISSLEKVFLESTVFTKVIDKSGVFIPVQSLSVMKGLKGTFTRHILKQMESADDEEKIVLEKALYYGIEAIDNGNIEKVGGELL